MVKSKYITADKAGVFITLSFKINLFFLFLFFFPLKFHSDLLDSSKIRTKVIPLLTENTLHLQRKKMPVNLVREIMAAYSWPYEQHK